MKQCKGLALVVMMIVALLAAGSVSAQATFTTCSGDFILTDVPELGTWNYPGGNIHVRGMVGQYLQDMGHAYCNGTNTVVTNANWDANMVGPSWGTFHMETAAGIGGWDGTWTGMSYPGGSAAIHVVGHGYGELDGMHITVEIAFTDMYHGMASATILDPHGG